MCAALPLYSTNGSLSTIHLRILTRPVLVEHDAVEEAERSTGVRVVGAGQTPGKSEQEEPPPCCIAVLNRFL